MAHSEIIKVYQYDEVFVQLDASPSVMRELSDKFTFDVPGAKYMVQYKHKVWDGKIRLLRSVNNTIYKGLLWDIAQWAKSAEYKIELEDGLLETYKTNIDDSILENFVESLQLEYTPYDYQLEAFKTSVKSNRVLLKAATSSGKSLIIYMLARWNIHCERKVLIVVPTISLVNQLESDFSEYSKHFDVEKNVHKICEGSDKHTDKPIVISTWQSIYKQHKKFFEEYDSVIVDEAHSLKAEAIKGILEKCTHIPYRVGMTGTLDNVACNELIIKGLTGRIINVINTKELIDRNISSSLQINSLVLKYEKVKDRPKTFADEQKWIINNQKRNLIIKNLAESKAAKGENVLILTAFIDHIKTLKELMPQAEIIYGKIKAEEREEIRKSTENVEGRILIATFGTLSTGVNIRNLQHLIFATGYKAIIKILQSIGRILRKDGKTNHANVWDIIDNVDERNITFRHFIERIKIYTKEKLPYKVKTINVA